MTTLERVEVSPGGDPPGPARHARLAALGNAFGLRADRQFMAGIDLVVSSGIGAAFGLLFWLVAARGFDEATVGVNAALISTMMLVSGLAGLGLPMALVRFLPAYGARSRALVVRSYAVAVAVTTVGAIAAGIGLGWYYDELTLLHSAQGVLAFAAACAAWQVFVLQDSVLIGIGKTRAVPVENTVFSIAKLGVLAVAIAALPRWGIFAAWVAPLAVIIIAVNAYIARRLRRTDPEAIGELGTRDLVRFSIGEHASTLIWLSAIGLLPLVVLGRLGDEANAFYSMSWAIAYNLMLVSANIGTAFIAQAATEPDKLAAQRTAAMRQAAVIVVPAALVAVVFAPQFLRLFGGSYAAEGSTVLRLLALAGIAHIPVAVYMATLRAERRVTALVVMAASEVALVGAISAVAIGPFGVNGVAGAWLAAEVVIAIVVVTRARADRLRGPAVDLWTRVGNLTLGRDARRRDRLHWIGVVGIAVQGVIIALVGLSRIPNETLSDVGLVSVVPPLVIGAVIVVVGTAVLAIHRRVFEERWAAAHVAVMVVLLSAAPSVAYETVRYPWAYKHIGIVDFIMRRGEVDRHIDELDVYHNWPGFFGGYATVTDLSGLTSAMPLADWAPVTFNIALLLGLAFTLRQLSPSRRVVWLACLLFFLTNWIGQDYFAPQALALVLYLLIIGTVLRFYRRHASADPSIATHLAVALGVAAMVMSHQLTPFFLIAALGGLAVIGEIRYRIPVAVAAAVGAWALVGAWPFVAENLPIYLDTIGSPSANAAQSFGLAAERSSGQVVVAAAGRVLIVGLAALSAVGALIAFRRPKRDLAPFVLAGAPLPGLFLAFGGEILFRVVLFMLPMLAFFAAQALLALPTPTWRLVATGAAAMAALVPFSLAYYGKDSFYTFTADEVTLVAELSEEAPPGSLLIEGTRNYPAQFLEYEKFVYVPINHEPTTTIEQVADAPADVLFGWMTDERYADAYVLLTDGQQAEAEAIGSLPASFLPELERALRNDPRFAVFDENDHGVVFTLTPGATG